MDEKNEILSGLIQELRRGTLVLSVLSQLSDAKYGYSLIQNLQDKHIIIEAGTLYPLLRRLEKQGILISEWETSGSKPRKYYILTPLGKEIYNNLRDQWLEMSESISILLEDTENVK